MCTSYLCRLTTKRLAASRILRYQIPAIFAAVIDNAVSTPNTKSGCSVDPSVVWNSLRSSTMNICQVLHCSPGLALSSPASYRPEYYPTGYSFITLPWHGMAPAEKSRHVRMAFFTMSQLPFDALGTCRSERLHVRESGMVSIKSTLEVNDSQGTYLEVSLSKLDKVFPSGGPRHTHIQQAFHDLVLQHSGFQAKAGGHPIIQLRAQHF